MCVSLSHDLACAERYSTRVATTPPHRTPTLVLDEDKWLRFSPAGVWIASNTVSKDKNESYGVRTYARSLSGGALPSEPAAWVDRKLSPQPELRVECFSKAEWLSQCERLETTAKSEKVVMVERIVQLPVHARTSAFVNACKQIGIRV